MNNEYKIKYRPYYLSSIIFLLLVCFPVVYKVFWLYRIPIKTVEDVLFTVIILFAMLWAYALIYKLMKVSILFYDEGISIRNDFRTRIKNQYVPWSTLQYGYYDESAWVLLLCSYEVEKRELKKLIRKREGIIHDINDVLIIRVPIEFYREKKVEEIKAFVEQKVPNIKYI